MGQTRKIPIHEPPEQAHRQRTVPALFWWFIPILLLTIAVVLQIWNLSTGKKASLPAATAFPAPTPSLANLAIVDVSPAPTEAATPANSSILVPAITSTPQKELVRAHLSFYWPPYGQINCDYECEHIANGDIWENWVGKGLACPIEYPLGIRFIVLGKEWQCVDRGDAIVKNSDGSIWLDLLLQDMPEGLTWGSIRTVEVLRRSDP